MNYDFFFFFFLINILKCKSVYLEGGGIWVWLAVLDVVLSNHYVLNVFDKHFLVIFAFAPLLNVVAVHTCSM